MRRVILISHTIDSGYYNGSYLSPPPDPHPTPPVGGISNALNLYSNKLFPHWPNGVFCLHSVAMLTALAN